jgi:hypothetical protein
VAVIVSIEDDVVGGAFGTRPERVTMWVQMVLGEDGHQITNVVIEVEIEGLKGNGDTASEISTFLQLKEFMNLREGCDGGWTSLVGFALGEESSGVFKVREGILSAVNKKCVELIAAPLNAVFNLVGEIAQRAHGDGLLWWILRVAVTEGLVRNDHLRVGLRAQSTRL